MIGVLIITHGNLGRELLSSAEGIVGKQPMTRVLGLDPQEGPDSFLKKLQEALDEMNSPAGVIVMADMMGGTPCNAILRLSRDPKYHFEILTGVNLPMLASVFMRRGSMPLATLAQKLVEDAPRHVVRPIEKLRESMKDGNPK